MSVRELLCIIQKQIKPIEERVSKVEDDVKVINSVEKRVELLENELSIKQEKIDTLTTIIINMQKSINMIDFNERSSNIIIAGLSEEIINSPDGPLNNDNEKVKHALSLINCTTISTEDFVYTRIGKPRENVHRMLKVKVVSKENRDRIMKNTAQLKNKDETWKKIYIKKDTHPVYIQETGRLRVKMKNLKSIPGNEDKVKIVDGNLEVDGKIVDKNTFFA